MLDTRNHFDFRSTLLISRLQRFQQFMDFTPGRCPGLLHFAPLALYDWNVTHLVLQIKYFLDKFTRNPLHNGF